ncbi:hypothetical protein ACFQY7_07335 [Actinomadura luteofluorescens]|uniref:hypothetical protein n=1 Tax=Actinomadura luteofluorescens TaxID=46163 RepID=UPI00362B4993
MEPPVTGRSMAPVTARTSRTAVPASVGAAAAWGWRRRRTRAAARGSWRAISSQGRTGSRLRSEAPRPREC